LNCSGSYTNEKIASNLYTILFYIYNPSLFHRFFEPRKGKKEKRIIPLDGGNKNPSLFHVFLGEKR
jgi:hypothetical protein